MAFPANKTVFAIVSALLSDFVHCHESTQKVLRIAIKHRQTRVYQALALRFININKRSRFLVAPFIYTVPYKD